MPLIERKALLEPLIADKLGLQFNGHETGDGELILKHAGKLGFEGVVSKTIEAPYAPGNRGLWRKAKWLNRQEFVIVGWSDPEGTRPHLGALLLGYYTDDGKLIYAGRVGTGMPGKVLADLRRRLDPLARKTSPLSVPPPRRTRFGSPLVLSRVHWVEPKLVAEITYLTWTADGLLRHTVYVGLREDKPAMSAERSRQFDEAIVSTRGGQHRGSAGLRFLAILFMRDGNSHERVLDSEHRAMDDRDRLAFYPFVVVRIACRVCTRSGSYRLARLAAKYGPEISLRDLTERFSYPVDNVVEESDGDLMGDGVNIAARLEGVPAPDWRG